MWRVIKNALPTVENLHRKQIVSNSTCPIYLCDLASSLHIFRNCHYVRCYWALTGLPIYPCSPTGTHLQFGLRNVAALLTRNNSISLPSLCGAVGLIVTRCSMKGKDTIHGSLSNLLDDILCDIRRLRRNFPTLEVQQETSNGDHHL